MLVQSCLDHVLDLWKSLPKVSCTVRDGVSLQRPTRHWHFLYSKGGARPELWSGTDGICGAHSILLTFLQTPKPMPL